MGGSIEMESIQSTTVSELHSDNEDDDHVTADKEVDNDSKQRPSHSSDSVPVDAVNAGTVIADRKSKDGRIVSGRASEGLAPMLYDLDEEALSEMIREKYQTDRLSTIRESGSTFRESFGFRL